MRSPILLTLLASLALFAGENSHAGKMIFTDRGAGLVRIANLDGSDLQTLIPAAGSNIRGVAIDLSTDDLFYADNGADIIYRSRLDGTGRVATVSSGLGFPADLALGFGKLYWCDRNNNRIERANYDGSGRETVVDTAAPYYLDLDRTNEKIYWGDFSGGNIFRADLTGANVETLVDSNVQTRGIKVDPTGGNFYWCDRNSHKVQRRLISGGPIEDLYTGLDTPHGMTLDIPAGKIYWVDTGTNNVGGTGAKTVSRGDMDGSGTLEILADVNQPWDITLDQTITAYPQWVARRFRKDAPASVTAPGADPDNDRNCNLIEYFGDLDPHASQGFQPTGFLRVDGDFLFTHRKTLTPITDVTEIVEISTDLKNWNSGPAFSHIFATGFGEGALLIVHKALPGVADPQRTHWRLRLELSPP